VLNGRAKSNKKLRIVRVLFAIVSHTHKTSVSKTQSRMDFVLELVAVERFATTSRTRPIAGLNKKVGYNSVENHPIIISCEGWVVNEPGIKLYQRSSMNGPSMESAKKLRHALGVSYSREVRALAMYQMQQNLDSGHLGPQFDLVDSDNQNG
jgi:hypothetical protein